MDINEQRQPVFTGPASETDADKGLSCLSQCSIFPFWNQHNTIANFPSFDQGKSLSYGILKQKDNIGILVPEIQ